MGKKRRLAKLVSILPLIGILSSCGFDFGTAGYGFIDGIKLDKSDYSNFIYHDWHWQNYGKPIGGWDSIGEQKALIVPVEFPDFPFTDSILNDINIAFNGSVKDTKYWESVSSFYEKSSFGRLKQSFEIEEPYKMKQTALSFMPDKADSNGALDTLYTLTKEIIAFEKEKKSSNLSEFDLDSDGFIDAIYLIYSCPNFENMMASGATGWDKKVGYWAITGFLNAQADNVRDVTNPAPSGFTWASYDFMYRGVKEGQGVDAHTYIHETSHLFGLPDYYNTSFGSPFVSEKNRYWEPVGGLDMLDHNILDHNAWTKFALGWNKATVIDSGLNFPLTIELEESQKNGDFILIPAYGSTFNGSAFDEYILVEFYTENNLNSLDSTHKYASYYPKGFTMPGIKIYHIDARFSHYNGAAREDCTFQDVIDNVKDSSQNSNYKIGASNSPLQAKQNAVNESFKLLHLLEGDAKLKFDNPGYGSKEYPVINYADNRTLFSPDKYHSDFNMKRFSSFFENHAPSSTSSEESDQHALFNSGKEFGYSLRVNGFKNDEEGNKWASITIDKVTL